MTVGDGEIQVFARRETPVSSTDYEMAAAPGAGWAWQIVGWATGANAGGITFKNQGGSSITQQWATSSVPQGVPLINEGQGYGRADANTALDVNMAAAGTHEVFVFLKKVRA